MFYSEEQYDEYQRDLEGDGYSNEYQRAAAESLSLNPLRNETWKAKAAAAQGKFAVLAAAIRYCRVTDGIMGEDVILLGVYDDEADAEAEAFKECWAHQDDVRVWVYREPRPAAEPEIEDDLPF